MLYPWGLCVLGVAVASAQTAVDLRTQTKNVDFSTAISTKPFQTGTTIPATCAPGQMFFLSTAAAGSNLYGCTASNIWTLESGGSGGGGGGAAVAGQLGDFQTTRTSANTLTIGPGCTSATPCHSRFGAQAYTYNTGATVTISGGTGAAYIYISNAGVLTVGHNVTASCSTGCTAQSGVSGFPADAIPLFTWTATSGAWDASGGTDQRAFLSSQVLASTTGIQITQTSGQNSIGVDTTVVGLRVAVPSTSSASCVTGTWASDTNFYYVCVSANTWKRATLSSF